MPATDRGEAGGETMIDITLTINGEKRQFAVNAGETLLELLRREGYKSVK